MHNFICYVRSYCFHPSQSVSGRFLVIPTLSLDTSGHSVWLPDCPQPDRYAALTEDMHSLNQTPCDWHTGAPPPETGDGQGGGAEAGRTLPALRPPSPPWRDCVGGGAPG